MPPRAGPVVDADGHVMEPISAWAGLPEAHRPVVTADAHGYEHVSVGGSEILAVPLGTLARPGSAFDDPASFRPLADAQPGGGDPVARLADMDGEGIDQAVLYPTLGLYFSVVEDAGAAVGLAVDYNDWLASYCAADPSRLFGAACCRCRTPPPPRASCAAPSPSSASGQASSAPTPASAARCPTVPTTSSGTPPRSWACPSGSTRAAR